MYVDNVEYLYMMVDVEEDDDPDDDIPHDEERGRPPNKKKRKTRRGTRPRDADTAEGRLKRRLDVTLQTYIRDCGCPPYEEHSENCAKYLPNIATPNIATEKAKVSESSKNDASTSTVERGHVHPVDTRSEQQRTDAGCCLEVVNKMQAMIQKVK